MIRTIRENEVGTGSRRWRCAASSGLLLLLLLALPAAPAGVVKIEQISPPPLDLEVPLPGTPGTLVNVGRTPLDSSQPAISADGEWVAFVMVGQVFERNRITGSTALVSGTVNGAPGNGASSSPAVSADGRFVAFASSADNLVAGTGSGVGVYVRDRQSGTTELVSVAANGAPANDYSSSPAMSADGRFVAFVSHASNLVPGDASFHDRIFVRDRQTRATEVVNLGPGGAPRDGNCYFPVISADGRWIAFLSNSPVPGRPYPSLMPGAPIFGDIYVWDRQTGKTEPVSIAADGTPGDLWSYQPAISADGRYVAFASDATDLLPGETTGRGGLFVRDLQAGKTERAGAGGFPALSADGRFVAFASSTWSRVPGIVSSGQIYVRDRQTGVREAVSVGANGAPANGGSFSPAISADGRFVAFASDASNLVPGDDNGRVDVFVAERG